MAAAGPRRLTRLERALRRTARVLDRAGCGWALVGGLAVSVRAEPRFTRDLDLAVAVEDDEAAEAIVHRLHAAGFRVMATLEHDRAGRLATVRLRAPAEGPAGVVVDLLFASSGVEGEIVKASEAIEVVRGLTVPVATTGHLIVMKLLARDDDRRPQDAIDLRALLQVATRIDLQVARSAARLITRRGFDRGRDLAADLRSLVRRRSGAPAPE